MVTKKKKYLTIEEFRLAKESLEKAQEKLLEEQRKHDKDNS